MSTSAHPEHANRTCAQAKYHQKQQQQQQQQSIRQAVLVCMSSFGRVRVPLQWQAGYVDCMHAITAVGN
jgi:hypothetical protein